MIGDELSHIIKQHVAQAMLEFQPFRYGHIANYDPDSHRVRCIVPSMQDDNGTPLLTPWMPMASMSAGAPGSPGYGGQIIYQGGATAQKPTAGEQVVIGVFDRHRGVAAVLGTFFNEQSQAPSTNLPDTAAPSAAGDVLWSNGSKSLIRIRANGDVEVWASGKFIANVTGDAEVAVTGNTSITTQGTTTITSSGITSIIAPVIKLAAAATDALQAFCTTAFRNWAASHVHTNTGPPTVPPPANSLTTIVQGE